MELVSATLQDLPVLVDWVERFYRDDQHRFDRREITRSLEELVSEPALGRACLLQVDSDRIGYLIVTFGWSLEYFGRDAFIDELFIVAERRNQGHGAAAIRALEVELQSLGVRAVHLEVNADNPAANLYRRLGYQPHRSSF